MCNNVIMKSQVQLLPWQGRKKKIYEDNRKTKINIEQCRKVIQQKKRKRQTQESSAVVEIQYIDGIDHDGQCRALNIV